MKSALPLSDKDVRDAKLFANKRDLAASFADRLKNGVIAEVGVGFGGFSEFMMQALQPKRFDAYDNFHWRDDDFCMGQLCGDVFKGKTHREFYETRFGEMIDSGKMRIFDGDSSSHLKSSDTEYNMIYIDADHTFEGVQRDTAAAIDKLAKGGMLIFNDYIMLDHINNVPYGTVYVVNDLVVNRGWKIIAYSLHPEMFCDVALERTI